jgi:hypothetical protein
MKDQKYVLNTSLAVIFGVLLLIAVLVRTFAPVIIIPRLSIPDMVLISLAALLIDHYVVPNAKRCYICIPVFAVITFGLLPFAACFVSVTGAVKYGVVGGVVFTAVTWLFSAVLDRLSTGPAAKAAPILSALGLYLASQCFMGMIL